MVQEVIMGNARVDFPTSYSLDLKYSSGVLTLKAWLPASDVSGVVVGLVEP